MKRTLILADLPARRGQHLIVTGTALDIGVVVAAGAAHSAG
jgi:hypothetical protein